LQPVNVTGGRRIDVSVPANRRFAVAVVGDLRDALNAARHLIESELEPQTISVIGQEASFANERQNVRELNVVLNREIHSSGLHNGSDKIISLAHNPSAPLPNTIAENCEDFRHMLRRWLIPEHAKRLSNAIGSGQFLLLAELHSMVDERIATRTLLRNSQGPVEVHDFNLTADRKNLNP